MKKILILFAHPRYEKSRINRALLEGLHGREGIATLGHRRYSATRAGQNFMKYDEAAMHHLAPYRHHTSNYISNAREQIRLQEQLLASDRARIQSRNDHAWDTTGPVTAAEENDLPRTDAEKGV